MLGAKDAVATVAVADLDRARQFYEGKLGLKPAGHQEPGAASYQAGNAALFVYVSTFAGTNSATAVTWRVGDDLADLVRSLKAKGVAFEHYDMPGVQRDGDIHTMGTMRGAWFKDPDGNIHALANA